MKSQRRDCRSQHHQVAESTSDLLYLPSNLCGSERFDRFELWMSFWFGLSLCLHYGDSLCVPPFYYLRAIALSSEILPSGSCEHSAQATASAKVLNSPKLI